MAENVWSNAGTTGTYAGRALRDYRWVLGSKCTLTAPGAGRYDDLCVHWEPAEYLPMAPAGHLLIA